MPDKQPIIQLAENCVVCGTPLDLDIRPDATANVKIAKIFVTVVHKECVQACKSALLHPVRARNALHFAEYALPYIEAEQSRLAAVQDAKLAERAVRAARPKAADVKALVVARNHALTACRSAYLTVQQLGRENEERPDVTSSVMVDEAFGTYTDALARVREADEALLALDPSQESEYPPPYATVPAEA